MTANVQIRNGSVVEDTMNDVSQPNALAELYASLRILKNHQADLRYGIRNQLRAKDNKPDDYTLPSDCDVVQYHELLRNVQIDGFDVGAIQLNANSFKGSEYFENHNLGAAIELAEANETEQVLVEQVGVTIKDRDKKVLPESDASLVPTTPDGTAMPLFVMSNDRNEGTLTFDEAKETLESFLTHIEMGASTSEPDTTDEPSDNQPDGSDDSDHHSVNDPTQIEGVGSKTVDKIESNGFEIVPGADIAENIEVEPFGFESDDEERSMPSPKEIIEMQENGWTKEEIKEMYC